MKSGRENEKPKKSSVDNEMHNASGMRSKTTSF